MWTALLVIHIVSGSLGLLAGPAAMLVPKRRGWHTRLGTSYVILVGLLCLAAIGLAVLRPADWWLGLIAAATLAAALTGRELRRRRPRGWLPWHISLMCGSYISLVTALLVVGLGLGSPVAWILPSVIGSPLIALRAARVLAAPRTGEAEVTPKQLSRSHSDLA